MHSGPFQPLLMAGAEGTEDFTNQAAQTSTVKIIQSGSRSPAASCLPISSHHLSGSAVSALWSKVKERSPRRSKGKEKHDLYPLVESFRPSQSKSDQEQSSSNQTSLTEGGKTRADAEAQFQVPTSTYLRKSWERESSVVTNEVMSLAFGLGEGFSLENVTASKASTKPISLRNWKPPKGFWREILAQPDTLLLNGKVAGHAGKEEIQKDNRRPMTEEILRREVQKLDVKLHRLIRQEENPTEEPEKLEGRDAVHFWGGYKTENADTDGNNVVKSKIIKNTSVTPAQGHLQPQLLIHAGLPPSYKETDWDASNVRTDLTLSPRHEQAKRLLERARLKARSQKRNDQGAQATLREQKVLPTREVPPSTFATAQEQSVPLPVKMQDDRDLNNVHFKDQLRQEAEQQYADKAHNRRPIQVDRSVFEEHQMAGLVPVVSQAGAGSEFIWGSLGLPKLQPSSDHVLLKDGFRKCETCGSILAPTHANDSSSKSSLEGQNKSTNLTANLTGQSSHQTNRSEFLGGVTLTGSFSLTENVEASGATEAEERVSAFGKLRRRSRKGESRAEAGHGPYVRGQELLAQRRNSRTRSSLEETSGVLKQKERPMRGVTFAIDHSLPAVAGSRSFKTSAGLQLPIKSALKSGSKGRPVVQRAVKLQPLVQYHLINTDKGLEGGSHHLDDARQEQLSIKTSEASQDPELASFIKPFSIRHSTSVVKSELQASALWDVDDLADAKSPSDDVCRDSICAASHPPERRTMVRVPAVLQPEDLRKSEHRKADLQWDEHLSVSQRAFEREGRPKLSLRRFFSSMGLNSMGKLVKGNRSSSMEQLSICTPRASPSPFHKSLAPLQRTPSLQALHTESPLAQLRKVSSVQSLQSPKRKYERPALPGDPSLSLHLGSRDLKVKEGTGKSDESQGSGPLGRLVQSFPDGTLLLELTRPINAPFGFVISRGKGRPDSGIYVEKVGGSTTESIYTALLGVGDEILEVNREMVAGLNLDQVTSLLTRESTATIRILPHRWIQR